MPFAVVVVLLDVMFVVHAAKTGRFNPWGYVILFLPGIGVAAYVLVELVPEWLGGVQGQRARKTVMSKLDPERRYRELSDLLEVTDTVSNRTALAAECLELGKFDEALRHYEVVLKRPNGDDPLFALGKARALFGMGHAAAAILALDELRQTWPDYQSADGHLLYARAMEAAGRTDEALAEFEALANYHPSAEVRVRHAQLLERLGRHVEARALFNGLLIQMRRAPKFARKTQAEWITIAERAVRNGAA